MKNPILITLFLLCATRMIWAEITLPSIIGDNMVLQQKTASAIWGKADPGEKVSVKGSWDGAAAQSVVADKRGNWMVRIQTPPAGGPFILTIKGKNTLTLKNVMSGEVWLAGGQSNMAMQLSGGGENQPVDGGPEAIAAADHPNIRLFRVPDVITENMDEPQFTCPGEWQPSTPESAAAFSAVAYFFGKEIYDVTDIPIGLILSSVGGSYLETWMSPETIEGNPEFKKLPGAFDDAKKTWLDQNPEQKNTPDEELPFMFRKLERSSSLYNSMISPLIPFTIKGVIWYQGESNGARGDQYLRLFPAMINNWRTDWGQGDFPFYFVQLANYIHHAPDTEIRYKKPAAPEAHGWAELRDAQFQTLSVKTTGMAVAIDIGEANNIHPANKKEVGHRLALWALAKDYGQPIPYSGPLYRSMKSRGNKIKISFDHTEGGLVSKEGPLEGFAIAGSDGNFVWADAVIDGDTVVVSSPEIKKPAAVRYAWELFPLCNLYNGAGLPASPFRTDDWKLLSEGVGF